MSQSICINIFIVKDGSHNSYASAESNSELNAYVHVALHQVWNCKRHGLASWQKKILSNYSQNERLLVSTYSGMQFTLSDTKR